MVPISVSRDWSHQSGLCAVAVATCSVDSHLMQTPRAADREANPGGHTPLTAGNLAALGHCSALCARFIQFGIWHEERTFHSLTHSFHTSPFACSYARNPFRLLHQHTSTPLSSPAHKDRALFFMKLTEHFKSIHYRRIRPENAAASQQLTVLIPLIVQSVVLLKFIYYKDLCF